MEVIKPCEYRVHNRLTDSKEYTRHDTREVQQKFTQGKTEGVQKAGKHMLQLATCFSQYNRHVAVVCVTRCNKTIESQIETWSILAFFIHLKLHPS